MSKWYTAFDNCSLEEFIRLIKAREMYWFVKRLSGNDTNLTKSHQSGIYVPYTFMKIFIPEICTTKKLNPTVTIDESLIINYSQLIINVKAKYYNNKFFPERGTKKLYNEYRFTSWGGKKCALQNPDNTGSILLFAGFKDNEKHRILCWVTTDYKEEKIIEDWLNEDVYPW